VYSGLLKTFFDFFREGALRKKVAYPIATGGSNAHLLLVDALKPVLSVLGVSQILEGIYVPNEALTVNAGGAAELRDDYLTRLREGAAALVASQTFDVPLDERAVSV
jgi:FMN reductase